MGYKKRDLKMGLYILESVEGVIKNENWNMP